jgi:hypothetical protein
MITLTLTGRLKQRFADTTGASIVIALVFFLICAVVGSTVLTAASINAQAMVTYKKTRQAEYTVSSAAALLGEQLHNNTSLNWDWSKVSETSAPILDASAPVGTQLASVLWDEIAGDLWHYDATSSLWKTREVSISGLEIAGVIGMDTVYADLVVDADFGMTIRLSLSNATDTASLYDETVYLQARPEYADNRLVTITWEDPVISKTGSG